VSYLNSKVIQRLKELRRDGMDPRDIFETQDLDRTGMVIIIILTIFKLLNINL
jgi:hypothetical protein